MWIVLGCVRSIGYAQSPEETSAPTSDSAQNPDPAQSPQPAPAAPPAKPEKRGEIAAAPIPVVDPTIGNGIALTAVYTVHLQKDDKVSPPSDFAAGGFRTSDGSWGFAAGTKLYLMRDRFRVLFGTGTGTVKYKFYGIGNESLDGTGIPIVQSGKGILAGLLVRAYHRWYVGSRYYYFKVTTGLDNTNSQSTPPIREVTLKLPVAALGPHIQRDTRDSQYYARSGSVYDTKFYFSTRSVGALFTYQNYEMAFQQYFALGKRQVLAYRVSACEVNGHAPFFALCMLGNSADMRGYPLGRYLDRRMLVGQVEYRREIWWRFGAAAFMGAGQVAPTFTDFTASNTRPGGGVGLRFTVAPKNHINIKADYGLGQGSHAWYVGIGEAF